ncbi:MAG: hypothetical protein ACREJM_02065, partial [Candidatus Saccharimonadales bacterium]
DGYGNDEQSVAKNWGDFSGDPKAYKHVMDLYSRVNSDGAFDSQMAALKKAHDAASIKQPAGGRQEAVATPPVEELATFFKASKDDLDILHKLSLSAEKAGYSRPLKYGIVTGKEPQDVQRVVRLLHDNYTEIASMDIKHAVSNGKVQPGTEGMWMAADAKASEQARIVKAQAEAAEKAKYAGLPAFDFGDDVTNAKLAALRATTSDR